MRLTRQEQWTLWVLLVLLCGGGAGRWWLRQHPPAPAPANAAAPARAATP